MSLHPRILASLASVGALSLLGACFDPANTTPQPGGTDTDATDGTMTNGPTSATTGETDPMPTSGPTTTETTIDPDGSTTSDEGECTADNALDTSCPDATPYCSSGTCVDCTSLSCADVDSDTPVCGADGLCIQCDDSDVTACEATQGACIDNSCVACTESSQCPGNVCLTDTGECLLESVTVRGVVYDYSTIDKTPVSDATVQITNVIDAPTADPTGDDGAYAFTGIVPFTSLDLQPLYDQNASVFVPATLSSRISVQVPNDQPYEIDVPLVPYEWMAKVAFECGLFPTLEEAIGDGAVNSYFIQRSTVFGQLVDDEGKGIATISKAALRAEVAEWANFQDNLLDEDTNPTEVCFLDEDVDSGTYVGTSDSVSNDTGRFVMFRLRNPDGLGQGQLNVAASGFDDAFTTLSSSGNIGVVDLLRNDDPIPRDFAIDIYPIFETYGCLSCHATGGVGAVNGERDGFLADWSLTPREVWENLVGPGTTCPDPANPVRICTDDPQDSLFVQRPLTDLPAEPDVHPVDIFTSIEDPTVQVMLQWIEQGALPPTEISFVEDIYPLFTKHGCVACHTGGGPAEAVSNGFDADWSLDPEEVYNNLVGPGTTCPNPDDPVRICTDDVLNSKFVTYPLTDDPTDPDDHPVNAFASTDHPDLQLIIQWIAQGADFENACAHDECSTGESLTPGCSPCVTTVCAADPFCCNNSWDASCVTAAENNPECGC
ncbi:MAG: carboxypeptidase-like regulatory domain-containing protein [Myxococcota bacterium]